VFPVRYGLGLYILFRRNLVFKGLSCKDVSPPVRLRNLRPNLNLHKTKSTYRAGNPLHSYYERPGFERHNISADFKRIKYLSQQTSCCQELSSPVDLRKLPARVTQLLQTSRILFRNLASKLCFSDPEFKYKTFRKLPIYGG
jgi:hypothetical protein